MSRQCFIRRINIQDIKNVLYIHYQEQNVITINKRKEKKLSISYTVKPVLKATSE